MTTDHDQQPPRTTSSTAMRAAKMQVNGMRAQFYDV
jgi:hypothetical protein